MRITASLIVASPRLRVKRLKSCGQGLGLGAMLRRTSSQRTNPSPLIPSPPPPNPATIVPSPSAGIYFLCSCRRWQRSTGSAFFPARMAPMSNSLRLNLLARTSLVALAACFSAANAVAADSPKSAEARDLDQIGREGRNRQDPFTRLSKDAKDRPTSLDIAITSYVRRRRRAPRRFGRRHPHRRQGLLPPPQQESRRSRRGALRAGGSQGRSARAAVRASIAPWPTSSSWLIRSPKWTTPRRTSSTPTCRPARWPKSKKRDEHWLKIVGQIIAQGVIEASDPNGSANNGTLLANLFMPRTLPWRLEAHAGAAIADMEHSTTWLDGPDGSTIVTAQQSGPEGARRAAPGRASNGWPSSTARPPAGHRSGLIDDFKLKRADQNWVICWNLAADGRSTTKPEKTTPSTKAPTVSEKDFYASQPGPARRTAEPGGQRPRQNRDALHCRDPEGGRGDHRRRSEMVRQGRKAANRAHRRLLQPATCNRSFTPAWSATTATPACFISSRLPRLQAADKEFKIAAVEELLKLHSDDKLLKHVLELEAKKSTKIER